MKVLKRSHIKLAIPATLLLATSGVMANDIDWEIYGSLRLQGESVDTDSGKDYTGLRDAYTRVGAKAIYPINDEWSLMGQLEAPFDLANMELQFSGGDADEDYRIGKLQLNSPYGTAWYGRGWLPFYNNITYPVDYFSSWYSGWQTYTSFRKSETFYYASPSLAGFKFDYAYVGENDNDRNQYVLSYSNSGLSLAIGRDDFDGVTIDGAAASYSTGPWYFSLKYEEIDSVNSTGFYKDGLETVAVLAQYKLDERNTLRAYAADGDGVGGEVYTVGWDHQYNDSTKFFVEYYDEDEPYAVWSSADTEDFYDSVGGSSLSVGVRYDFSSN